MRLTLRPVIFFRSIAISLILVMLTGLGLLTGCEDEVTISAKYANYGAYGSELALKLATSCPFRSPGSEQEKAAGDYLIQCFKDLGYKPVVTEFSFKDSNGADRTSRNIAVVIPGSGFTVADAAGKSTEVDRQVIIGAHYDTSITAEKAAATVKATAATAAAAATAAGKLQEPRLADTDGIQDNASGVGTLLTAAKEMKSVRFGYDVILVAFGAGEAGQAGARHFVSQMKPDEIAATDAMYCVDSIYAGDKVYVHSGRNTLKEGYQKDYEKRRKLYEVTDVFYEFELYTNNKFMLYTNQSSLDVKLASISTPVLYREWSLNNSDYVPFDENNIPIVFFDSFDYDEKSLEAMMESQNPSIAGGKISGTQYDSSAFLSQLLNSSPSSADAGTTETAAIDLLTRRINNIAFIILEAVRKGISGATAR